MLGLILLLVLKVYSSNAVISVEAISGSSTTLTCPRQGSSYQWLKVWSTLQQVAKYGNVNTSSLIIYNVDPNDEGLYMCKADNVPDIVSVTVIVIATEGNTTTLTCPLQGTSYTWFNLNSDHVIIHAGDKHGDVKTRHLVIYKVDPYDGGTYVCRTGPGKALMNIVFRVIAIWGSNTTLTCTLPGSNYYWQKRTDSGWSSQLQKGDKYGNVNSELMTIYNVQTNDSGRYLCGDNSTQEPVQVDVVVKANGNWGTWQDWNSCSATCGNGLRSRRHECNNPVPAFGGSDCPGNDTEIESCLIKSCPVHGHWGTWQDWSSCSATCGNGSRSRRHECNNPVPAFGGSDCPGNDKEIESCSSSIKFCPVHGNWGTWQDWNSCSATCGNGSRSRRHECNNPVPAFGGSDCPGNDTENESCSSSIKFCAVHGNWGTWQDWNSCSATCGNGSRSRRHECNNPVPAFGGSDCPGNDTEIESCSIKLCPETSVDDSSSPAIGIGSTAVVVGLLILSMYIL